MLTIGGGGTVAPVQTFTIANGADGSAVDAVSIGGSPGGNYKAVLITCTDCSNIAASTSLTALFDPTGNGTLVDLYEVNDPSTQWSKGDLPTSGTLGFVLTHAFGLWRLRLVLSQNASGGNVVFNIYGIDGGANV